jgi:glycosyltransferase involved in cell wall biosynthesis
MVLGLLPEIRGGLGELARTGQHSRFVEGYLRPYARAFDEVRYFSYLGESLERYTDDAELRARVRIFPGGRRHPWLHTLAMPIRYRRELRECSVLRVFQVTGVVPALIAKRWFGVPFVTTYGFWYSKLTRSAVTGSLGRVVAALGLRVADAVIVPTQELAAHVGRWVPDPAAIHMIPNGVDTSRFRPAARAPRAARKILYVGRLSPEKNLETLVAAVAKLAGRFELGLTVVGAGALRERLERMAGELGVSLEIVPFADHLALPAIYRSADVFVLPSLTEGHSKVLLEAMSCGLPCVASDVGGNRAILAGRGAGLLFDPGDAGALAAAIERVLTHEALARDLGERARAEVDERYDLAALVALEIALLKQVASAAGRARARSG